METRRVLFENGKLKWVKPVYCCVSGSAKESLISITMTLVCKLKGCPPVMIGTDAEASMLSEEKQSSLDEAFARLEVEWSPADKYHAIEFERTIRKLSSQDFVFLACAMEAKFHRDRFGIEVEFESPAGEEVIKDNGLLMSYCVPAIAGASLKTLGNKLASSFEHSTGAQPYEEAAIALGIVFICSAMLLKDKKAGLSKVMAKVGVATIAFAVLLPLVLALHPLLSLLTGLLMAFTVVGTLALI